MTKIVPMPRYSKNLLKIFLSGTKRLIDGLGTLYVAFSQVCTNDDSGLAKKGYQQMAKDPTTGSFRTHSMWFYFCLVTLYVLTSCDINGLHCIYSLFNTHALTILYLKHFTEGRTQMFRMNSQV